MLAMHYSLLLILKIHPCPNSQFKSLLVHPHSHTHTLPEHAFYSVGHVVKFIELRSFNVSIL